MRSVATVATVATIAAFLGLGACRTATTSAPERGPTAHRPDGPDGAPPTATAPPAAAAPASRAVRRSAGMGATIHAIDVGSCALTLEVFAATSVNAGGASLGRSCDLEGEEGVEALAALIAATRDPATGRVPFRWLKVQGMGGARSAMRVRLASAALRSPDWDRSTGAPRGKRSLTDVVASLAAAEVIFPEGQRAFRMHGSCLTRPTVEEVGVRKVSEMPAQDQLLRRGARAADSLPWSMVLWYDVAHGAACP